MLATPDVMWVWANHLIDSIGTETEKLVSMDNYYSHKTQEFLKEMRDGNCLVDHIPADTSDLIQTNDRGLGKIWKDKMTEKIDAHL